MMLALIMRVLIILVLIIHRIYLCMVQFDACLKKFIDLILSTIMVEKL